MKRIALKQEFHGEPDPCEEEWAALGVDDKDEVVFDVVGGSVSLLAPSDVPDDELMAHNLSNRYICCSLKLENGGELSLWINQDANDVDVRLVAPKKVRALAHAM
ncbi:MAG: hypothetical protein WCF84_27015 [Anaerolineae bacterium]